MQALHGQYSRVVCDEAGLTSCLGEAFLYLMLIGHGSSGHV
jgi:hypothetical protein